MFDALIPRSKKVREKSRYPDITNLALANIMMKVVVPPEIFSGFYTLALKETVKFLPAAAIPELYGR